MTEGDASTSRAPAIRAMLLALLLVALAGAWAGFFSDGDFSRAVTPTAAIGGVITAAVLFQLIRDIRRLRPAMAAMPSSERKPALLVIGMFAAGVAAAMATFAFGGDTGRFPAIGSLTPAAAGITAVILITLGPWTTWLWWRATDEHERQAYLEGAHIAASAALYLGIGWWLLSRAELVPPPDGAAILIGISFVWTAVWLWRKYF